MSEKNKEITREEAIDMLEYLQCLYSDYLDYSYRSDYVQWSEENEDRAWREYADYRDKIVDLIVK